MIDSGHRPAVPVVQGSLRLWAAATAIAGLTVSIADTALIQRTRGLFTGGFLSVDHMDGWGERASFIAISLLSDAAVAGLLAALALVAARRLRLRAPAALLLAVSAGAGPLLLSDIVSYELLAYLGDAFDLQLMFDLTGRSLHEILAVSSAHLMGLAVLIGGAAVVTALAVTLVQKRSSGAGIQRSPSLLLAVALVVVAFLAQVGARTRSELLDDAVRRKPTGQLFGIFAHTLTDLDHDGFGILGRPRDPAWRDAAVYPYAVDYPGDGIDQDGLAGDFPAALASYSEESADPPQFAMRPNVVLVVLESFRADLVGATLNGKPVTPTMNALAREGISVPHAYSHNGYTTYSRQHLFTGSLADVRGERTLIDDFRANGYEVAYFSGQDESFGEDEASIHADRADVFYDARQDAARRYSTFTSAGSLAVPYEVVLERVGAFMRSRDRSRPLFLYVNFHDTHFPYWHQQVKPLVDDTRLAQGDIAPDRQNDLRRMYANTAANIDAAIGEVLKSAEATLDAPPAVIVTSDHGESLFDEGFLGHGYALNDAQTRVPLIVRGLPIDIVEPFAQSSLRSVIWRALSGSSQAPPVTTLSGGEVFQYLGTLDRPRQIALTGVSSQRAYDFRENRARFGSEGWKSLDALTPAESKAFVELVQFWERLRLARANAPGVAE